MVVRNTIKIRSFFADLGVFVFVVVVVVLYGTMEALLPYFR